jgi:poly(beta-D-mannuronate) lyase
MFTLRHGNRCIVDSNFFLGRHKTGSGGIRVIGEDHTIINNYIDGVEKGAFWITAGIPDSPLNGYYCARRCLIAFNTVIDSRGPILDLDAGFGTSNRSLRPENITIANNIFALRSDEALLKGTEGDGFKWVGNVANRSLALTDHHGIRVADFERPHGGDGMWQPAKDSPIRGAAERDFPTVKTDIQGQPRSGVRFDVGCDQLSDAPVINHPLSAAEVGPSWMGGR